MRTQKSHDAQTVVGDHLEVRFLPPEHDDSLAGSLHAYAGATPADLAQVKQEAWKAHVEERRGDR